MNSREVQIFLVEDDEIDRLAIKRAFDKERIKNSLLEAVDGVEAWEILKNKHPNKKVDSPFILLLDINMPRMNGLEFLEKIRNDEELNKTIVFILTTSVAEEEKARAYNLYVSGYISKQNVGVGFVELVKMLDGFWRIVEFPQM